MLSFKEPGVHQTCYQYFYNSASDPTSEAERPRKRVRLSAPSENLKGVGARSSVIKAINDLLGLQENSELTTLSQIAMFGVPFFN